MYVRNDSENILNFKKKVFGVPVTGDCFLRLAVSYIPLLMLSRT
jgi:hypothetical protein